MKEKFDKPLSEEVITQLISDERGNLYKNNQANYAVIIKNDKNLQDALRYNEMTHQVDFYGKPITDSDLVLIETYIAKTYTMTNTFMIYAQVNPNNMKHYHPILDLIKDNMENFSLENNGGMSYIDNFLKVICKSCDNYSGDMNELETYSREVSRMIFYGGIKRLMEPGCQFDYMPIFEAKQGAGKSTIVKLLSLDSNYYNDIRTIDGKEGMEQIMGMFVVEMSELLAMVRSKDVEGMKAFITRTCDKYRQAYARKVSQNPRSCIIIGTTNDASFLNDITGNRRYLPIHLNMTGDYLFENMDYVKKYILNCWCEAYKLYEDNKIYTAISPKYAPIIEKFTNRYVIDDPMEESVSNYVNNYNKDIRDKEYAVCAVEIYTHCLNGIRTHFSKKDSKDISNIMNKMPGWVKYKDGSGKLRFGDLGLQRCWVKKTALDSGGNIKNL